jgi:hypothetical protein
MAHTIKLMYVLFYIGQFITKGIMKDTHEKMHRMKCERRVAELPCPLQEPPHIQLSTVYLLSFLLWIIRNNYTDLCD